ncbi:phosphotransferase, partial [Streptomyces sp. NPDC007904]|uniref:phosphotransferase n=1 Tax=Streptomyces sp. NPDC007904 TaxID=3364787 RepID=UPI0036E6BCD6
MSAAAAPDAERAAARVAAGVAESLPGRGLNASYRLVEAGVPYAVKVHCAERSGAVEAARIRRVDALLRGAAWYPPVLDLATVRGNGRDHLVVVRPYAPGVPSDDARAHLPDVVDVLAELAAGARDTVVDDALVGDYATPWLTDDVRERERVAPLLTGEWTALGRAVDVQLPAALAGAARLTRAGVVMVHHGDLHGRNLISDGAGRLTVIDWDETGFSRRPADAGKALWLSCRQGRGDFVLDPVAVRDFLELLHGRAGVPYGQAADVARLGAVWFLPRREHIDLLARRGAELGPWYLGWIERFWARYAENVALVAATAAELDAAVAGGGGGPPPPPPPRGGPPPPAPRPAPPAGPRGRPRGGGPAPP